jgi:hypothetical protein
VADIITTALVPSVAIDAILAERDAIVRSAEQVEAISRSAPDGFVACYFGDTHRSRHYAKPTPEGSERTIERVRKLADRDGWQRLIDESGLRTFMDAQAREEWDKQMHDLAFPPLTTENAEATARSIHEKRGDMVARGVRMCFERLRPYQRNRADRFGDRMIVRCVTGYFTHDGCDTLDDLNRALHLMRKLPEPDHRNSVRSVVKKHSVGVYEFPFFTLKTHKNSNGHVHFTHGEDVKRLNAMLSIATGGASIAHGAARAKR